MSNTLSSLYRSDLLYVADMENQIRVLLPKVIQKVTSPELKKLLQMHLDETEEQSTMTETLIKELSDETESRQAKGIRGIVAEIEEILERNSPSTTLDLALIEGLQRIEHYEIATYGALANYAQELGLSDNQDLLFEVMQEEKAADEQLTAIAETLIPQASPITQSEDEPVVAE